MANIDLIIRIPDDYMKYIDIYEKGSLFDMVLTNAIKNGTPLPKGHGDLVDFDKLCEEYWDGNYLEIHCDELASIQPIIEADKAEREEA